MPQIFQVIKCYKCSIFQVHQTKKDNKWKCKVCNTKQSVKRHYGIGTAKDCRTHVQKLNMLQGDMDESKLKVILTNSPNSEDEENIDYVDEIRRTNIQTHNNFSKNKESKWSAYVDRVAPSEIIEPECIESIEACLELPQKRKINRKCKPFKVPKVSSYIDYNNKKTEIINNLPDLYAEELNNVNIENESVELHCENTQRNLVMSNNGSKIKLSKFQKSNNSKWAYYIADEDNDHNKVSDNDVSIEENMDYFDNSNKVKETEYTCQQNEIRDAPDVIHEVHQQNIYRVESRNICRETNSEDQNALTTKQLFSMSDVCDLDNILNF